MKEDAKNAHTKPGQKSPVKSKGIYGKFLSTKQAEFSRQEQNKIRPKLIDEKHQSQNKVVDLSAIRKGLNYRGSSKN